MKKLLITFILAVVCVFAAAAPRPASAQWVPGREIMNKGFRVVMFLRGTPVGPVAGTQYDWAYRRGGGYYYTQQPVTYAQPVFQPVARSDAQTPQYGYSCQNGQCPQPTGCSTPTCATSTGTCQASPTCATGTCYASTCGTCIASTGATPTCGTSTIGSTTAARGTPTATRSKPCQTGATRYVYQARYTQGPLGRIRVSYVLVPTQACTTTQSDQVSEQTEAVAEAPAETTIQQPPTEASAGEPVTEAPAEAPAETPTEAPAEAPAETPTEAPAEAPAETPAQPTETPAQQTETVQPEPTEATEVTMPAPMPEACSCCTPGYQCVCVSPTCVGGQCKAKAQPVSPTGVGGQCKAKAQPVSPTCVGGQCKAKAQPVAPTCVGGQCTAQPAPTCANGQCYQTGGFRPFGGFFASRLGWR